MSTIASPVTGSVWKILVAIGAEVDAGQEVAIIESMKMEIPAEAETAGIVTEVLVAEGDPIEQGDPMIRLTA